MRQLANVAALLLVACTNPIERAEAAAKRAEVAAQRAEAAVRHKAEQEREDWQRMKDCAHRTDEFVKKNGFMAGRNDVFGWGNHYNPRYARCYVAINYIVSAKRDARIPLAHDELYDAFEGALVATCTDFTSAAFSQGFCSEPSSRGDCNACRRYINDRMDRKP